MSAQLNAYLNFNGTTREAMEYYHQVFGGKLDMNTFGEFGQPDSPAADLIMHAMLVGDNGFALMAADVPPGMPHNPGTTMTLSISGDDPDTLHGYWDKLSDGGSITMPLEKQAWGDEFGMFADRFGIPWMVNIGQPQG
jgi:PhnB protein